MATEKKDITKRTIDFSIEKKTDGVIVHESFTRSFPMIEDAVTVYEAEERSLRLRSGVVKSGIVLGVVQGVQLGSSMLSTYHEGEAVDAHHAFQLLFTFLMLTILRATISRDLSKRIQGDRVVLHQLRTLKDNPTVQTNHLAPSSNRKE